MRTFFQIDPWQVARSGLPDNIRLMESLTSIGNGYMGMRGNFEEGYGGDTLQGTYLAGVWFPDKTRVGWWKNGYPAYFGKVINAVNFARIGVEINGQVIDLSSVTHEDFHVSLDMRSGLLMRRYTCTAGGATVRLSFERFFSIVKKELAFFRVGLEALSGCAEVCLTPALDGNVRNEDTNYEESFWDVDAVHADEPGFLQMTTVENPFDVPRFTVGTAMRNALSVPAQMRREARERGVEETLCFTLRAGEQAILHKTVAVMTSRDVDAQRQKACCKALLEAAVLKTYEDHLADQTEAWAKRWRQSDVEIGGCDEAQQGIRYNLFQLFSTYYGEDSRLNIGPKGFTGEKYGGATYWDTEAFILPMYLSVADPEISRKLLEYRYDQLGGAQHNARQQGLRGALYPMVTFTGVECHNEWEITFEEIHRNGAIAYAIFNYTNYTGDETYLLEKGIDVLVEISRFWADRVHFSKRQGQYMIHGVTGPNEYENNVNNNWYTNTIARWTLGYTLAAMSKVGEAKRKALKVTPEEMETWQAIYANMYLPEDETLGIFVQHDTFLDKELRSTDTLSPAERPLNQHWSWDRILRSCFIKQADVLQGIYLFPEAFTREQKERNFQFYEPMTVHESSLSASIHAILAAELGLEEKATELYDRTARLDLDNYNNDTGDGLHITSMSGSWLAIVQGFAGMRTCSGTLSFSPFCPRDWTGYSFRVRYQDRHIQVRVTKEGVAFGLCDGMPINVMVNGTSVLLAEETFVAYDT